MTVALVGLGYWGPKLLRNLVMLVGPEEVVAVDYSIDRIAAAQAQFPGVRFEIELEEALSKGDVDGVVIATPVATHARLAHVALDHGCHILVEKPLAGTIEDAVDILDHADDVDRRVMVGHTFLFSPRVARIEEYLRDGQLGDVHYVTSSRLNLGLYRNDVNVIWDLAAHDFSILFHLLGEFPEAVQTAARSSVRADVPETAFVNLTFGSGVIASVAVSWRAPRKVRSTVIVGDDRMIAYDDTNNDEPVKIFDKGIIVPDSADFAENQLTYRYGDTLAPHIPASEPLTLQIAEFLDVIRTGVIARSDGAFGLRVVEALEAADRSWRQGGQSVAVESLSQGARL